MLSSRESAELAELRERVYGPPSPEPVLPATIHRLQELEQRESAGEPEPVPDEVPSPPPAEPLAAREKEAPESSAVKPRRRRSLVALIVGAVAIFVAGAAAGGLFTARPGDGGIPELEWAQASEDVIFSTISGQDPSAGLEPDSVRFIANVENTLLYIGHQAGTTNVCLVVITTIEPRPSVTCGTTGVTAEVRDDFLVEVGPVDDGFRARIGPELTEHRLSASVTAFYIPAPKV
ncbi:hypothetical protein ACTHRI_09000 [Microbacterium algihabitans]|uniref:hypothetical protein n=1 Tax=Microbacterium algihabitans TaxID=3075992 RepID=UPI003F7F9144